MKLTGYMILLNVHILIWGFLRSISSMTLLFGRDVFSIEYDILAVPMYSFGKIITTIILMIGSIDYSNLRLVLKKLNCIKRIKDEKKEFEKLISTSDFLEEDDEDEYSIAEDESYVFVI